MIVGAGRKGTFIQGAPSAALSRMLRAAVLVSIAASARPGRPTGTVCAGGRLGNSGGTNNKPSTATTAGWVTIELAKLTVAPRPN